MTVVKHVVNGNIVATIPEVLREMNVAQKLGYKNDNYTGTPIYAAINHTFGGRKPVYDMGNTHFYSKAEIEDAVSAYLDKKTITPAQRKAKAKVIQVVKNLDPAKALDIQELIKQYLAVTK
jgi:hypothetical protein